MKETQRTDVNKLKSPTGFIIGRDPPTPSKQILKLPLCQVSNASTQCMTKLYPFTCMLLPVHIVLTCRYVSNSFLVKLRRGFPDQTSVATL